MDERDRIWEHFDERLSRVLRGISSPGFDEALSAVKCIYDEGSKRDRAILEAAAERVAKVWLRIDGIDCDDLEELKKAVLEPITKEKS